MDGGAVFGMMNAMRTGNLVLDMVICMTIPAIFKGFVAAFEKARPFLHEWALRMWGAPKHHFREIIYEQVTNQWGSQLYGKDERNNILQKAISLYMADQKIDLKKAKVSLMAVKEKGTRDKDSWEMKYGDTAEALKAYQVNLMPRDNEWVKISDGLEFMRKIKENEEGDKDSKIKKRNVIFEFRSERKNGKEIIDKWINVAFDWYTDQVAKTAEKGRYMYNLLSDTKSSPSEGEGGGGDGDGGNGRKYKRYLLSDHKTFGSIFFREKEVILKILKNFEAKTGKYAIPGYPHKLGLLLHGPPGTGKTSLIKCMAQATGRNIVNVPLSRIKTNQELMDIVFDQSFQVVGEELPIKLGFKDLIFVMEDVDAASKIVHSRAKKGQASGEGMAPKSGKTTVKLTKETSTISRDGRAKSSTITEEKTEGGEEEAKNADGSAPQEKKTKITKEITIDGKAAAEGNDGNDDDSGSEAGDGLGPLIGASTGDEGTDMALAMMSSLMDGKGGSGGAVKYSSGWSSTTDKLDLAGLLNVLDGVVDCPNRIVIMTTNHPEKLDAALIRPGRIDKKIYLGYMEYPEACQMVEHYFQCELDDGQRLDLEMVFDGPHSAGLNFTPAMIEQFCAEYDEVDDFIKALGERVHPINPSDLPKMGHTLSHLS